MGSLTYYLVGITMLMLVVLAVIVGLRKKKSMLHYLFLALVIQLFIWSAAACFESIVGESNHLYLIFEKLTYIGSATVPVTMLLISLSYARGDAGLRNTDFLLYLVPLLTQIIVWTNDFHHLFYVSYSVTDPHLNVFGPYFYFHAVYSYLCLVIGFTLLIYFAVRNLGILSIQALLMILGGLIPISVNLLYTANIGNMQVYSTPIAFSFACLFYMLGLFRYNLLNVAPVALQNVVNMISDSFVAVDGDLNIIFYNRSFYDNFSRQVRFSRKDNFYDLLKRVPDLPASPEKCRDVILGIGGNSATESYEWATVIDGVERHYTIELTPIVKKKWRIAVIILLKDVTQHVLDLKTIHNNQAILLERERLAALGQLIGGIAHNLKTPIMSVAGGIEQLKQLTTEYSESLNDPEITPDDHREIATEMQGWLDKMKQHMAYMSDIISAVKDQASTFSASRRVGFSVVEMFKRIELLMKHELVRSRCKLIVQNELNESKMIQGDVNSLVQIFDNIIMNAIQSYQENGGEILVRAWQDDGTLCFSIRDQGSGIPKNIQDRLFKEMITTKGKHGTGLGLYMSHSTIKGMFRGNMWFVSTPGQGTEFFITLPETIKD
ncbi:MAG: histidine kinase N-terminal 7TM domain-containing protein [Bacillota bacterium]